MENLIGTDQVLAGLQRFKDTKKGLYIVVPHFQVGEDIKPTIVGLAKMGLVHLCCNTIKTNEFDLTNLTNLNKKSNHISERIILNEKLVLFGTDLSLDSKYKNGKYSAILLDNEKEDELCKPYYEEVASLLSISVQGLFKENIISSQMPTGSGMIINQWPNGNDKLSSLLRDSKNREIIDTLDTNHIYGVWMTTKKYAEDYMAVRRRNGSTVKGLIWKDYPEDQVIPYPEKVVIKRFKEQISMHTDRESLKILDGNMIIMLLRLGDNRKIDEDIIVVKPYGFYYEKWVDGNLHLYFKKGKILHIIKLEDLYSKKEYEWITYEYNGKKFPEFVNFYYESKKK